MARKKTKNTEPVVTTDQETTVEETVEEVVEVQEQVIEAPIEVAPIIVGEKVVEVPTSYEFKDGEELVVTDFVVRGLIGLKGAFVSVDDKDNITLRMANGTLVTFKRENLQRVSK